MKITFVYSNAVKQHQMKRVVQFLDLVEKRVGVENRAESAPCLGLKLQEGDSLRVCYQKPPPCPSHCGRNVECLHPYPVASQVYLPLLAELDWCRVFRLEISDSFLFLLMGGTQRT